MPWPAWPKTCGRKSLVAEAVPYSTLCLVSDAFDCDPIDLVRTNQEEEDGAELG